MVNLLITKWDKSVIEIDSTTIPGVVSIDRSSNPWRLNIKRGASHFRIKKWAKMKDLTLGKSDNPYTMYLYNFDGSQFVPVEFQSRMGMRYEKPPNIYVR